MRIMILALLTVCLGLAGAPSAIRTAHAKPASQEPSSKAEIVSAIQSVASAGHKTANEIQAKLASDEKMKQSEREKLEQDGKRLKKILKLLDKLASESAGRERAALLKEARDNVDVVQYFSDLMKKWHDEAKAILNNLKA